MGKKKQTALDLDDLPDPLAEPNGSVEPAGGTLPARSKGKKGKKGKGKAADWLSDDEAPAAQPAGVEDEDGDNAAPASAAGAAKQRKGKKKGKGKAAAWESDEEEQAPVAAAAAATDSDGEAAAPGPIPVKKKMGKQPATAAFDLLAADGSEPEAEAASDEDEPAAAAQLGLGALEDGSEAEEAEKSHVQTNGTAAKGGGKAKKGSKAEPSTALTSKMSKKEEQQADANGTFAALGLEDEDPEVAAETANREAEPRASKKGKKKKVDVSAAFAALEVEEADPEAAAAVEEQREAEEAAPAHKMKKKKKKVASLDVGSAFAALGVEDDGDAQAAEPTAQPEAEDLDFGVKVKKPKKKKVVDVDSLIAALDGDGSQVEAAPSAVGEPATAEVDATEDFGAKKKRSKKKSSKMDFSSAFEELGVQDGADTAEAAPAEGAAHSAEGAAEGAAQSPEGAAQSPEGCTPPAEVIILPAAPKSKKKKNKKATAEDEDALLAELASSTTAPHEAASAAASEPQPDAAAEAAAPAAGSKKKKKKGRGAAKEDEDLDALLAEMGIQPGTEQPAGEAAASLAAAEPAAAAAAPTADEAADKDDYAGEGDEPEDGKEMSAAQKKKAKKKAKDKAKKAADVGDGGEAAQAPSKKGTKKVSAAVRKMQEEVAARQAAEAEAGRLAEEQRIAEEEAERKAVEEEARKQAEAERRKVERAERRAQLKKEGKLLTGKAKKGAERLAAVREQFLKQAGLDGGSTGANGEQPPARKRVVYASKKKQAQPSKREDPTEAATQAEEAAPPEQQGAEAQAEAASSTAAAQEQAEAAKAAAQEELAATAEEAAAAPAAEEDESDGADDWEAMDLDSVPKLGKAAEEEVKRKAEEERAAAAAAQAAKEAAAKEAAAKKAAASAGPPAKKQRAEAAAKSAVASNEDTEDESDEESEEESSEYSSSEEDSDSDAEAERRLQEAKDKREARLRAAIAAGDKSNLRSPICCILGHVDTGKTKILDNVRRTNVQDGEAGGITQQIGATYIPDDALTKRTSPLRQAGELQDLRLPGLLIIDTPGHESFTNLRSRGSSLCDIAILVVDLMHGLEQQTIESINLLKMRKTPFIIALNKVDRLFDWKVHTDAPIQVSLAGQKENVRQEFDRRLKQSVLNLNEQGLNVELYWKNSDRRKYVNIVPTSAITGEGIPDMLQLLVDLTQSMMASRLMSITETQCTVLEVKVIEGLGTTVDVVLVNGVLHEGDTVVLCGMGGPIVTQIRSLLTPHPLKELRVRGSYLHHKQIKAAQGVKIAAPGLEHAVAGTQMLIVGPDDDVDALKDEAMEDMQDIFSSVDRSGEGVCVQASTLGSLEALLEFLRSPAVKIPVSGISIGPIHKRDIMRANVMMEKGTKKYACLLAFDVPVTKEAREMAESLGVRIFTADIIYHLFDQFTAYLEEVKVEEQAAAKFDAVFPCILRILPNCVFNTKDPIVVGVDIEEGIAKVGTPLCIPSKGGMDIGRIASIEQDHKAVDSAKAGKSVAMKIEPSNATEASRLYGRHFDHKDLLVSRISRKSINLLKEHFKQDMSKDDWRLVVKLKGVFRID